MRMYSFFSRIDLSPFQKLQHLLQFLLREQSMIELSDFINCSRCSSPFIFLSLQVAFFTLSKDQSSVYAIWLFPPLELHLVSATKCFPLQFIARPRRQSLGEMFVAHFHLLLPYYSQDSVRVKYGHKINRTARMV